MRNENTNWRVFVGTVKNFKRDWRPISKIYKPACLFAVLNLIDSNKNKKNCIEIKDILEEFNNIVAPVCPSAINRGYLPIWHLTEDEVWFCLDEKGVKITKVDFRNKKQPKSEKELLIKSKNIELKDEFCSYWMKLLCRNLLKNEIVSILNSDNNNFSEAFSEYLRIRYLETDVINESEFQEFAFEKSDHVHLLEDYSKFCFHRVIERNSKNISEVKKIQGYKCKICNFDFKKVYGDLGEKFIEAHHVIPVSKQQGKKVKLDPNKDFMVLCANCHRMIHRVKDNIDNKEFIERFGNPKLFFI